MGQDDTEAWHLQHQLKPASAAGAQHLHKPGSSASFPLIRSAGALPTAKRLG